MVGTELGGAGHTVGAVDNIFIVEGEVGSRESTNAGSQRLGACGVRACGVSCSISKVSEVIAEEACALGQHGGGILMLDLRAEVEGEHRTLVVKAVEPVADELGRPGVILGVGELVVAFLGQRGDVGIGVALGRLVDIASTACRAVRTLRRDIEVGLEVVACVERDGLRARLALVETA